MTDPLDPVAVRILGALIEKEFTTPDNYPLTLNALTAACNQTSNREPVMDLDETAVSRGLATLAQRSLARGVHRGDSRVMRYRQEISDKLHLHKPELAVLCVLLLRGPQTVGEIRTRTGRMAEFADLRHVEITLDALATLPTPLVTQLPRRPGQKEVRFTHLLAGEPAEIPEPVETRTRGAAEAGPTATVTHDIRASERDGHTTDAAQSSGAPATTDRTRSGSGAAADRIAALEQQVGALRDEVAELRAELEAFRRQFE